MSTRTAFGSGNPQALNLYKGYPNATRKGQGWELTFKYWTSLEAVLGLIPAHDTPSTQSGFEACRLTDVTVADNGIAGMVDLTLVYRNLAAGGGTHAPGETRKESTTSFQDVDIDDPRLVTDLGYTAAQILVMKGRHQKRVDINSVEYTLTTYLDSFAWSQSAIVGNVGKIEAPTDMTSPTAGRWLNVGSRVSQTGDGLIEQSTTWKYHVLGWK